MSADVDPSPKKPPEPRTEPRKRSVRWHVWWSVPIVLISLFFLFAIQAEQGPNHYGRTYSLAEAVAEAWEVPLSNVVLQPRSYLLPYALIVHVLGSMALQRRLTTLQFRAIAFARTALSSGLPLTLPAVYLGPIFFGDMILGTNGETYSEGVLFIAVGWWAMYQIVILVRDSLDRLTVIDECAGCRYSRAGLAMDAKCPECGLVPAFPKRA